MKKFFLFLVALLSIVACSKSDSGSSGNNGSNDGTYTVKVVKNPNVTLTSIAVSYDGSTHLFDNINTLLKNDYTKEFKVTQEHISISVTATSNTQTTLIVQLLKNGKVIKESTANGTILVASISI